MSPVESCSILRCCESVIATMFAALAVVSVGLTRQIADAQGPTHSLCLSQCQMSGPHESRWGHAVRLADFTRFRVGTHFASYRLTGGVSGELNELDEFDLERR